MMKVLCENFSNDPEIDRCALNCAFVVCLNEQDGSSWQRLSICVVIPTKLAGLCLTNGSEKGTLKR